MIPKEKQERIERLASKAVMSFVDSLPDLALRVLLSNEEKALFSFYCVSYLRASANGIERSTKECLIKKDKK